MAEGGTVTRVVPIQKAVNRELIPSLKTLYDIQREVDLTLLTQDKEAIVCHSIVAAANSPYIQQCLENNINCTSTLDDNNSTFCIQIVNVNKQILSKIVKYFYTGDIEITIADVTDLLLAAIILQIDCLIEQSYDIVHNSLCIKNYKSFLQFSLTHDIAKLQEICHTFMYDDFPSFLITNELSRLDVELLISIIKEDGCRAESEDMILDAVVEWLQSNSEGVTTEIIERLMDCVRFEHCTSRTVYDLLDKCHQRFAFAELLLHKKCLLHLCCEKANEQGTQVACRNTRQYSQTSAFDNSLQHTTALMYHHEDHDSYIANKIYYFYLNGFVRNLSINTKDGSVDCHKAVLVAICEYFRLMFDVSSTDVDINVVELDTSSEIVKDVLQFIYKGTTNIHEGNVELLLAQSINIQLQQLTLQCKDFIEENLSIDKVVQYHECSMSLQYEPLNLITSAYIQNNCIHLLSNRNLTKLRIDSLKSLLAYMNTDGVEEHIKLDIIVQWLTVHSDCNDGEELLNGIHFDNLSTDCLKSIKDNPLIKQQHKLLIQESLNMKYEQESERQLNNQQQIKVTAIHVLIGIVISITIIIVQSQFPMYLQELTPEEHLVMMTKNYQISIYDDSTNNWIELMHIPDWVDDLTSWYASGHRIVIAGASHSGANADRVAVLDVKSQDMRELPRLPEAWCKPGVVFDGDEVYIIGGKDRSWTATNTMYYTNITQDNGWTTLPAMPTATYASVISVDNDHIYVFGGGLYDTLTQIYNKHTQQWSQGATIPAECHSHIGRCVKERNGFTVITEATMMKYHLNDDTWKIIKQYERRGGYASAVSYKGYILSCGIHKKNKISLYDPDSDDVWVEIDINVKDIANESCLIKVYI